MIVESFSADHLEVSFYPDADLPAIVAIGALAEGTNVTGMCKVSVIFVRTPLTADFYSDKIEYPSPRSTQATLFPLEVDNG